MLHTDLFLIYYIFLLLQVLSPFLASLEMSSNDEAASTVQAIVTKKNLMGQSNKQNTGSMGNWACAY